MTKIGKILKNRFFVIGAALLITVVMSWVIFSPRDNLQVPLWKNIIGFEFVNNIKTSTYIRRSANQSSREVYLLLLNEDVVYYEKSQGFDFSLTRVSALKRINLVTGDIVWRH